MTKVIKRDTWRQVLSHSALALVVIAFFLMVHLFYEPWGAVKPNTLTVHDTHRTSLVLKQVAIHGEVRGNPELPEGAVLLPHDNLHPRFDYQLRGFESGQRLCVRGEASAESLIPGDRRRKKGRIIFVVQHVRGKARWASSHQAVSLEGTKPWQGFDRCVIASNSFKTVRVRVSHRGRSGVFRVRNLSVQQERLNPTWPWLLPVLASSWILMMSFYMVTFRLWTRPWGWSVLVVTAVIVIGMLMQRDIVDQAPDVAVTMVKQSAQAVGRLVEPMKPLESPVTGRSRETEAQQFDAPVTPKVSAWKMVWRALKTFLREANLHKLGHIGLFFLLGVTIGFAFLGPYLPQCLYRIGTPENARLCATVYGSVLFAMSSELLQVMTFSRDVALRDLLDNLLGLASGLCLFALLHVSLPARVFHTRKP